MELVRWNPRNNMAILRNRINRMPGAMCMWKRPVVRKSTASAWNPAVDVYDDDEKFVVTAELPGIDKQDISVDLKAGVLTVRGERALEDGVQPDKYYRRERASGAFQRAFAVPDRIDPDKISAEFKDGVLKIDIPKPEKEIPKKVTIH